jgi:hypothetical protein
MIIPVFPEMQGTVSVPRAAWFSLFARAGSLVHLPCLKSISLKNLLKENAIRLFYMKTTDITRQVFMKECNMEEEILIFR